MQQRDLGLRVGGWLRPLLGRKLSTLLGLGFGATRYVLRYGFEGVGEFVAAVTRYVLCCTALSGAATICLDATRARHFAAGIEPLAALGSKHVAAVSYDFCLRLAMLADP